METVSDFIFLGSKITTDGDCSCEIKRHLPRQHIKKERDCFAFVLQEDLTSKFELQWPGDLSGTEMMGF